MEEEQTKVPVPHPRTKFEFTLKKSDVEKLKNLTGSNLHFIEASEIDSYDKEDNISINIPLRDFAGFPIY